MSKNNYEVVLEIKKINIPKKEISVPVTKKELKSFLEETEYIKPNHPSIQRQSDAIRQEEKDAYIITKKILEWTCNNIEADMIMETLSGPEILEKRKGKCSEYAILFASLARAVGIPVKIVLGNACVTGNTWIGHMWNEVWLGEWIAVDPNYNSFITGPTHIKFADSSSVMGVFPVRMRLIDNLSLKILDFTEEEGSSDIKTGIFKNTYYNKAFSCKISAPDSGWTIKESTEGGQVIVTMELEEDEFVSFSLVPFPCPKGVPAEKVLRSRINSIAELVKNYEKISESMINIADEKVLSILFQHDLKKKSKDKKKIINMNAILAKGTNGYLFAFITPEDKYDKYKKYSKQIIDSFEIIE